MVVGSATVAAGSANVSERLALLISIGTELVVASALIVVLRWGSAARTALAAAIGTIMTHWLAWWAMIQLMDVLGYVAAFVLVETAVTLVEGIAYALLVPLRVNRALAVSLIANAASAGLGLVIEALDLAA